MTRTPDPALAILLLAGSLIACAGNPTFVWSKPGATEADMRRDAAGCTNEGYMIAAANRLISAAQAYRNCMVATGWTLDEVR